MIGRIDDTCRFVISELYAHDSFDFALQGQIWSKIVMEEREAPSQIILGANDPGKQQKNIHILNFIFILFTNYYYCRLLSTA